MGETLNLIRNPKTHQKWVKSGDSGWKLMKYWPKQPIFTSKVGLFEKCPYLTEPVT
jgi:hypothetical protein